MIVPVMHAVAVAGFTFVKVIAVAPVQMTVVQIVDVITMRNRDMSATVAMRMVVPACCRCAIAFISFSL
ncbi:putative membrane protein [Mycobacterium ulcerans str. Harvey]|uniref:Membrane protein n=1 Tax=Mycobacterium ulcerans str. Harvey TaxID=1299332 RepID=A0ABN0R6Z6_MYCUL|nr:putative membrane protein [Mycobacterium ulcerans str. Harvey]